MYLERLISTLVISILRASVLQELRVFLQSTRKISCRKKTLFNVLIDSKNQVDRIAQNAPFTTFASRLFVWSVQTLYDEACCCFECGVFIPEAVLECYYGLSHWQGLCSVQRLYKRRRTHFYVNISLSSQAAQVFNLFICRWNFLEQKTSPSVYCRFKFLSW